MPQDTISHPLGQPFTDTWSQAVFRDGLQLIAEGVTELVGFGVACISVLRHDKLEVVAVAGTEEIRERLKGVRTPVKNLLRELENADSWGLMQFVPHERLSPDTVASGWVPDITPLDVPDAWHPLDLLIAPLHDSTGRLLGTLSMDLPDDGRRPGPEQRRMLEKYAAQAGRAVVTALERERLAEQVRLANAAKTIVRGASAQLSMDSLLAEVQSALVGGFGALGMWIQTFGEGGDTGAVYSANRAEFVLPPELVDLAEEFAQSCWRTQTTLVFDVDGHVSSAITDRHRHQIRALLTDLSVTSILFAPLGAGTECLGNLVLTRDASQAAWTDVERSAALDMGHDLGRAILNARTFERERKLVKELRALDTYKSQLIATVSHELKNPLTAILGHLEILETTPGLTASTQTSLAAMDRGAVRLRRVVDDLLLLSEIGDPANPVVPESVDLRAVVAEVVDLTAVLADRKGLKVRVDAPDQPVCALGKRDELDLVCSNLVSNAVKYTPEDGSVTVTLSRVEDRVVLQCSDDGIGISPEDRNQLFDEFFRSANPDAFDQPGTGLGLAIVKRIVERHQGTIEVDSELGRGSTFTVTLPAAP